MRPKSAGLPAASIRRPSIAHESMQPILRTAAVLRRRQPPVAASLTPRRQTQALRWARLCLRSGALQALAPLAQPLTALLLPLLAPRRLLLLPLLALRPARLLRPTQAFVHWTPPACVARGGSREEPRRGLYLGARTTVLTCSITLPSLLSISLDLYCIRPSCCAPTMFEDWHAGAREHLPPTEEKH